MKLILPALLLISLCVGCATQRTYSVLIENSSSQPITVGLVKTGGPNEDAWASPEQWAISSPQFNGDERHWGTVIPPGHVTDSGKITGKFSSHSEAVLRVYLGDGSINQLMAISRGQPQRLDIPLDPGRSEFIVRAKGDKLGASQFADR